MKIIELTESNFDKYQQCLLKVTIEYRKSDLNLPEKERKEWIFNKVYNLMCQ